MRIGFRSASLGPAVAIVICLAPPQAAFADWPPFGRAICTAPNGQTHAAIADDGAGGAIICWQDHRSAKVNIFAQHVRASGEVDTGWPVNGRAMMSDASLAGAAGGNFSPLVVSDGSGGGIVAWVDLRDGVSDDHLDIIAQHVLASGALDPGWEPDGAQLVSAAGLQSTFAMVSDGAGGAIVTWIDNRAGEFDVYAQHVLASGIADPDWPADGLAVCTAPGTQQFPAIVEDGTGGALITWDDLRSNITGADVFAQHVLNSGGPDSGWPVNGLAVCTAAGNQGGPTIASDGVHGAVVAWTDGRVANAFRIFAHHVLGFGAVDPAWPVNGRAISNAGFLESRPRAVSDGAGGAVVNWQALGVHLNMFAQHVTAGGVVDAAWPAGGRALSVTNRQQSDAQIASDGAGGAVVAWVDSNDVFAQHVLATGALDPAYPDTGGAVVNLPGSQGDPAIVATGAGGAIVTWTDARSGVASDIFALQVLAVSTVDVPGSGLPGITFARPVPNPTRGPLTLRFTLPNDAPVRLAIYDVTGRRVRALISGASAAGPHAISWDLQDEQGRTVRAGLYFARIETEGRSLTQKLATLV